MAAFLPVGGWGAVALNYDVDMMVRGAALLGVELCPQLLVLRRQLIGYASAQY